MRYNFKAPDLAILQSLYLFPYMTAEQVTQLLYSPGSLQGVRARLKKLSDKDVLRRSPMFSNILAGSNAYVYWLATIGRNQLKDDYDFSKWQYPSNMKDFIESKHFNHFLAINDFLIATTLVSTINPNIQLKELTHDFYLKQKWNKAGDPIPDGLNHFIDASKMVQKHINWWVEVDLGSEKEVAFKDKIGMIIWHLEEHKNHLPLIIFWTPKGEARRDLMLKWIEEKLTSMYMPEKASWFRVGCGEMAADLFFQNCWYTPLIKTTPGCLLTPAPRA